MAEHEVKAKGLRSRLRIRVIWTQWAIGISVWWWIHRLPTGDREFACGIQAGPLHIQWIKE